MPLLGANPIGCASQAQQGWWSAENSDSGNSNSGNSDSGKSDNSGNTSQSNSSKDDSSRSGSDGSSNTHSESSGQVSTQGNTAAADAGNGALLVLTGSTLLGLAIAGTTLLLDPKAPAAYLDKHAREVRLALARGEGPFVRDVAHNLGIGEATLPRLGEVLRAARPRLHPLLAHGDAFAAELVRVLLEDPELGVPTRAIMKSLDQQSPTTSG